MDLQKLYSDRFTQKQIQQKLRMWDVLVRHFFQQYVDPSGCVVDMGAGYCEFINAIQCERKIAVDINPDIRNFAHKDVEIVAQPSTNISSIPSDLVNAVFMSNFLEHLKSKEEVLLTFKECYRILAPGGKILLLQPNIRYLYHLYWDYFDHHTALSDLSICEGLRMCGFSILKSIPRFLPYTVKSKIPKHPMLIRLYLAFPPAWRFMGKQCCVIGVKPK